MLFISPPRQNLWLRARYCKYFAFLIYGNYLNRCVVVWIMCWNFTRENYKLFFCAFYCLAPSFSKRPYERIICQFVQPVWALKPFRESLKLRVHTPGGPVRLGDSASRENGTNRVRGIRETNEGLSDQASAMGPRGSEKTAKNVFYRPNMTKKKKSQPEHWDGRGGNGSGTVIENGPCKTTLRNTPSLRMRRSRG